MGRKKQLFREKHKKYRLKLAVTYVGDTTTISEGLRLVRLDQTAIFRHARNTAPKKAFTQP